MSRDSSLTLFYPSDPPPMTAAQLGAFAADLRKCAGVKNGSSVDIRLKYGDRIDQDYLSTVAVDWMESGLVGTYRKYEWDDAWQGQDDTQVFSSLGESHKAIYRAFLALGTLTSAASQSIERRHESNPHCFFVPEFLSISVDPYCPECLGDSGELVCVGLVSVSFSGGGYLTWGVPWSEYADQCREAVAVREALRVAREHFPVAEPAIVSVMAEHLGERYLNRSYYEPGDWILTVDESG